MIGLLLRWLPLSIALHAVALGVTLLIPRPLPLAPLFVDLTLAPTAPEPVPTRGGGGGGDRAVASRQRAAPRPAALRAAGRPASRSPEPSAAMPPAAPVPEAAPSLASAPTATPPVVLPRPDPDVPPASSAPPASPAPAADSSSGESSRASWAWNGVRGGADTASRAGAAGGGSLAAGGDGASSAAGAGDRTLALAIPGDGGGVYAPYLALLRRRVQEVVTYPAAARRRGASGTVHLEIALEPSGLISEVRLVRSSSHGVLDDAALDAVRSLRRVPFPPDVRPRALRVRLPVVFELR